MRKNQSRKDILNGTTGDQFIDDHVLVVSIDKHKAEEPTEQPEQQAEQPTETPKVEELKQPKNTAAIIEKAEKMNRIISGINALNATYRDLDNFHLSGSKTFKSKLSLNDGRGAEVDITNTNLIDDAINYLKDRIETRTGELEAELQTLEAA